MIKQFLKKDIIEPIIYFFRVLVSLQSALTKEQNSSYLTKLKKSTIKISFLTLMFYTAIIIFLYKYYNSKIEIEKAQMLRSYYEKIINISLGKINSLAQQIQCDLEDKNTSIRIDNTDIQVCCSDTACNKYRVFQLGSLLDQYIPDFIYYKIEINNNFTYANTKINQYQIDKPYRLNDTNQLNVSLDIDNVFWLQKEAAIREPLWLLTIIISITFLLLFVFNKILLTNLKKGYNLYYQNQYKIKVENIELNHQQELENCKLALMNKIWNLNFYKQKDLEINCLFAQAANQMAYSSDIAYVEQTMLKNFKFKYYSDKVPCSILLYQNDKIEEINVDKLIKIFTDRFAQEDDNILLVISSNKKIIRFVSQAALYQIIYSLISYLFFLLRKQATTVRYRISLHIKNLDHRLQLKFEYNGFPIKDEIELSRMADQFFKTHANPFLLNSSQVFNVLRSNGFNCIVNYDQFNIIDIIQQETNSCQEPEIPENNIISISPFIEKNK